MTDVDIDTAFSGERCQFHPGCCDMEEMTCAGCGEPAIKAMTFRRHGEFTQRRTPFCDGHERDMLTALLDEMRRQRSEAN